MWAPWGNRLPRGGATTTATSSLPPPQLPPPTSSIIRSSSSLKDLLSLLDEYDAHDASASPSRGPRPPPPPPPPPVIHHVRSASSALRLWCSPPEDPFGLPPGEKKRVVLYFTSLRAVRHTFEDCAAVRAILCGLRVAVDERDVSMDAGFLRELKGVLGVRRWHLGLPQLFIGGRHVGGADDVRRLHEAGELRRYVEGAAQATGRACEWCGDVRFVLCRSCSGSRRCYHDKGGAGGGFRTCTACNENGLVRCRRCCDPDAV
ncbi:uncharacterized protein At5g39865-like [Musa acuminata AAA Group]|uniref:(wild Malaysian banana) hypothetical protein n=1 Tax=Musa acuminata subsp. malaccensis TaxID=214687 RepID=A0A804JXI6_MUSAM|nr:PREDICTED: uncharacterized protein At5g39865-like [Musa acuminata subsp. malaccensis]CAG1857149.1 unnamed protein product [Musa acuminata subsp. malaccensis]